MAHILIVDDDESFGGMLEEALSGKGHDVLRATSAEAGLDMAQAGDVELVLLDVMLPGMSGLEAIDAFHKRHPEADVIVMTAFGSRETAVAALRRGAYDFFAKPFSLQEMEVVVRRVLEKRALQSQVRNLRKSLEGGSPLDRIIGDGQAMRRVKEVIARIAPLDTTVLITGESGTGKELISDVIHAMSPRASGPLVKVNCAAIPDQLLESELFGHEKGAFTDAKASRKGRFEQAEGGSLMLDEIGDMPLSLQPKLLRAVEQRQVERLGGAGVVDVDVRIIAATNQDLHRRVKAGEFRGDLYYRLNVATVELPALRERKEDIPDLAHFFLGRLSSKLGRKVEQIAPEAMELLMSYDYPGNVRQLANVMERAVIFAAGERLTAQEVQMAISGGSATVAETGPTEGETLKQTIARIEKALIVEALRQTEGVQIDAAKKLGLKPKNLWNKLQKHGIDAADFRANHK
jgi:two-component system response regulator AtoC